MSAPAVGGAELDALAASLEATLPGRVERAVPMARLSTYRLGGPVAVLARAGSLAELRGVAAVVREQRPRVLVVGRGSNLLVADRGFGGLALLLDGAFEEVELHAESARAGGAVPLPVLARQAAAAGRGGIEYLVGIPGTVGGAVAMNAGGHGRETAEALVRAWTVDLLGGGEEAEWTLADLAFGYRRSALRRTHVVTRAEFGVVAEDAADCEARVSEIVRWRRAHQPGGKNAGSVFRNPPGDSAGRLIEACGLKGFRVGGAVVSEKHANFFQAEAGATADDVWGLVGSVRRAVADRTGVKLEPELRMIGFTEGLEDR